MHGIPISASERHSSDCAAQDFELLEGLHSLPFSCSNELHAQYKRSVMQTQRYHSRSEGPKEISSRVYASVSDRCTGTYDVSGW